MNIVLASVAHHFDIYSARSRQYPTGWSRYLRVPLVRNLFSTGFRQHFFAPCQWTSIERTKIQEAAFLISRGGTCLLLQLVYQGSEEQMDALTCRDQRTRVGRLMEGQKPLGKLLINCWKNLTEDNSYGWGPFWRLKNALGWGKAVHLSCSALVGGNQRW